MITPVISLVSEAIGSTAWSFLLNSTSRVSWSITRATLDFRSSGSCAPCRPASWPNDSRGGEATITTDLRGDLETKRALFRLEITVFDTVLAACDFLTIWRFAVAASAAGEIKAAEKVRIPTTCKVCLKIEFSVMDIDSSPDAINTKPQCIQIEKVTQYQKLA